MKGVRMRTVWVALGAIFGLTIMFIIILWATVFGHWIYDNYVAPPESIEDNVYPFELWEAPR